MDDSLRALSGLSLQPTPERTATISPIPSLSSDTSINNVATPKTAFPQAFPFLRLPKPIRRLIYELLPVRIKYVPSSRGTPSDPLYGNKPVVIVILRYIERSIVQTCHVLAAEAEPVLEIETMKLGPPRLVVAAEYFHRLPPEINILRSAQDEYLWQRLRLQDTDRGNRSLEEQRLLMWSRLLHLNMLSEKRMLIGIYIARDSLLKNELEETIPQIASQITQQLWWEEPGVGSRPLYEAALDWEGYPCPSPGDMVRALREQEMFATFVGDLDRLQLGWGQKRDDDMDDDQWVLVRKTAKYVVGSDRLKQQFGVSSLRELFLVDEEQWKDIPARG